MKARSIVVVMIVTWMAACGTERPNPEDFRRSQTGTPESATTAAAKKDDKKPADNKTPNTAAPVAPAADATKPAAPATPPAAAPAAPAAAVGVPATGKTLLTQTCFAGGCHSAAATAFDAKTPEALTAAGNVQVPVHQANKAAFFTAPAAGAAPNSFSHVLAYFKMFPNMPLMGPALP